MPAAADLIEYCDDPPRFGAEISRYEFVPIAQGFLSSFPPVLSEGLRGLAEQGLDHAGTPKLEMPDGAKGATNPKST